MILAGACSVASCEGASEESRAQELASEGATAAAELSSGLAARSLRAAFPDKADRVLGRSSSVRFVANEPGFGRAPSNSRIAHLDVQLPSDGAGAATITAPGGFEIRVREIDARGRARAEERAIVYERTNGSALWTATERGAEEWIHLAAGVVASMEDVVATWEIEGAEPVVMNGAVAMMDHGVARAWMTADEAFSKDGRKVDVRLGVRDHRVELFADARGEEVLIDPDWVAVAPAIHAREGGAAITLQNGRVLIAGGRDGGTYVTGAEVYDPVTNTWLSAGTMVVGRRLPASALLPNGTVLLAGGEILGQGFIAAAEIYDPATNTWAPTAPMSIPRGDAGHALLANGKVLVVGGYNGGLFLSMAEIYDPATGVWTSAGAMSTARAFPAVVRLPSGKVLVAGGENGSMLSPVALATAELYDPATNTWSSAGVMTSVRYMGTSALLPNNKVLVASGVTSLISTTPTTDLYDPATNTWSAGAPMSVSHGAAAAGLLGTGSFLVAGGFFDIGGVFDFTATAELYNPAADTWTSAGDLSQARYGSMSALVGTGDLLVIGGLSGAGAAVADVDRYSTATGADGSACSVALTCASGFCVDGVCCQVAACAAKDPCHSAGTCQAGTGTCDDPEKADGTACDDGNGCTQTDTCSAGVCTGADPVECTGDECYDGGFCDPDLGTCTEVSAKPDGTPCSIGTCQFGTCVDTGTGGATNTTSTGGSTTGTGGSADGGSGVNGDSGGCGCRVAGYEDEDKTSPAAFAGLALAALTWARRRRPRASKQASS